MKENKVRKDTKENKEIKGAKDVKEKKENGAIRFLKSWFLPIVFMVISTLVVISFVNRKVNEMGTSLSESFRGKEGEVHTITESELKEVVMQSKLYTIDYPYNGYVAVLNDEDEVKYYVAYRGSVKAGIDVDKIEYSIDEENSVIYITLPEVTIDEPVVEAGSMDFIFFDNDENTEDVAQEAYRYAIADIKEQISSDNELVEEARKSAEATERALIEPWINQYDGASYKVIISTKSNEK